MGAEVRHITIKGRTFEAAWKKVVAEDIANKGTELYNSGLCHIDSIKQVATRAEFDEVDFPDKHYGVAFCTQRPILNTNKTKTEVIRHPNKAKRVWKTVYVAELLYSTDYNDRIPTIVEEQLAPAIVKARAVVEKNPEMTLQINIEKKLSSPKLCAEIKYKRSTTERDGIWECTVAVPC